MRGRVWYVARQGTHGKHPRATDCLELEVLSNAGAEWSFVLDFSIDLSLGAAVVEPILFPTLGDVGEQKQNCGGG